jgi:diguanylate cyclase (GGDEF)-like protein
MRPLAPFAALGVLGLLLIPAPGESIDTGDYLAAIVLSLVVLAAALLVPWERLPRDAQLVPALAYVGAIVLLRDSVGGAASGVGLLVLSPVVWFALYGTRRQLFVVIGAISLAYVVPILAIGAPKYPSTGWRGPVLIVALSTVIGTTVQRLVSRVARQSDALRARDHERTMLLSQVQTLAATDELTGLPNRRTWNERVERTLAATGAAGCCVALLDLDRFKALNDDHGHEAGDRALRESADAWLAELRPQDTLARLGGDEFAVLLPECDVQSARRVVERLRSATRPGVTASAGVAEWDRHESPAELLARADAMLYHAKVGGRDRTVATDPALTPAG